MKYGIMHSIMQLRRSRFRSMRDTISRTGVKKFNIDGSVNDRCKELMYLTGRTWRKAACRRRKD